MNRADQTGSHTSVAEEAGLRLSVWGALGMGVLGLGFSTVTGSQAILLDGFFSLIGFFIGLLTLKVSRLVRRPDDEAFQFGYGAFEPSLNLAKGLMISGICLFALISAVQALLQGGRPIQSGPAVGYAFLAAAGCFAISWAQRRRSKVVNAPLLSVDAKHWLMDGAVSSAVGVAFIGGMILQRSALADWVDYLDPGLVVALVVVTAYVPIGIIRESLWEVLLGAPSREAQEAVRPQLAAVLSQHDLTSYRLRMLKVGRSFFLLLHVLLPPAWDVKRMHELDALRAQLCAAVPPELQPFTLDVVFTHDPQWLEQGGG